MTATGSDGLEMLFPYLTGNLLKLTNRQAVQLVRMSNFTYMHTGVIFRVPRGFYLSFSHSKVSTNFALQASIGLNQWFFVTYFIHILVDSCFFVCCPLSIVCCN